MGAQGRTDAGVLLTSSCMQVCVYQKENRSKKFRLSGGHRHSFQVPLFLRRAKPAVKPFGPFSRFCCEAALRSSEMGALRRSCMSSRRNMARYAFPRAIRVWRGHEAGSSGSDSSTVVACHVNSTMCSVLPAVLICCVLCLC